MVDDIWTLWRWPFDAARVMGETIETMAGAQRVVAARLPTIAGAMQNPFTADHDELGRMVREKVGAFGAAGRSVDATSHVVRRAARANGAALGRMARGHLLWPTDWIELTENNLAAAASIATLPGRALAPVRRRVAANEKRLGRAGKARPRS